MLSQQEKLAFCKICKNRSFNSKVGLVCGLTNETPVFETSCPDFNEDVKQVTRDFERAYSHKTKPVSNSVIPVSAGTRFANALLDGFIHSAIFLLIAIGGINSGALNGIEIILIRVFSMVGYYAILEGSTGKSIGKMVTGTMVVMDDGAKPTTDKIITRSFARLIPFNALSFLFLDGVGWHDTISETRVVSINHGIENEDEDILDRF